MVIFTKSHAFGVLPSHFFLDFSEVGVELVNGGRLVNFHSRQCRTFLIGLQVRRFGIYLGRITLGAGFIKTFDYATGIHSASRLRRAQRVGGELP